MKIKNLIFYRSLAGITGVGAVALLASSAPAQNLFVSNYTTDDIYQITPGGVQSTFASGMNYPGGLAFNSAGDLFVANSADNGPGGSIVEIAPGGTESTFATGVDPIPLAFNSAGDLFEGDYNSGNIYEFSPGGVRSTFATGLSFPISMTINSAGDLFIGAGYGVGNGYIEEITPNSVQSRFASGLAFPGGLAFNSAGDLLVTSASSGTIYQYTPSGVQTTYATLNYSGLNNLAFSSAGNLFVATGSSIVEITPDGTQSTFASGLGDVGVAFAPVPEPSVYALLGLGAARLFIRYHRMWRKTISI